MEAIKESYNLITKESLINMYFENPELLTEEEIEELENNSSKELKQEAKIRYGNSISEELIERIKKINFKTQKENNIFGIKIDDVDGETIINFINSTAHIIYWKSTIKDIITIGDKEKTLTKTEQPFKNTKYTYYFDGGENIEHKDFKKALAKIIK